MAATLDALCLPLKDKQVPVRVVKGAIQRMLSTSGKFLPIASRKEILELVWERCFEIFFSLSWQHFPWYVFVWLTLPRHGGKFTVFDPRLNRINALFSAFSF